ncbi:MAG: hypothetical protein KDH96_11515, partial [Candidatus Riesia sp.]|nr:hypothetical protein [Candidatus Riesia sp.]
MGFSLRNIGKKLVDFSSRAYDQVNMLDNGRTYKQRTPTNDRSVIGQTTHNAVTNTVGNIAVKPFSNIVSGTVIEPARSIMGSLTNNNAARMAAENRKNIALNNSLPYQMGKPLWETGDAILVKPAQSIIATVTGNDQAYRNAQTGIMQSLNETPFGQLFSPVQHTLAGNQVNRDMPNLSKEDKKKVIEANLTHAGLDPTASLGKQSLEAGLAALQLYGGVKAPEFVANPVSVIKGTASDVSNFVKGTGEVV